MADVGGSGKKVETKVEKTKSGECPWCNYENADEKVGELHEKEANTLSPTLTGGMQCGTCGKHWRKEDLGKPYSIELERGPQWARQNRARQLGSGGLPGLD